MCVESMFDNDEDGFATHIKPMLSTKINDYFNY